MCEIGYLFVKLLRIHYLLKPCCIKYTIYNMIVSADGLSHYLSVSTFFSQCAQTWMLLSWCSATAAQPVRPTCMADTLSITPLRCAATERVVRATHGTPVSACCSCYCLSEPMSTWPTNTDANRFCGRLARV